MYRSCKEPENCKLCIRASPSGARYAWELEALERLSHRAACVGRGLVVTTRGWTCGGRRSAA